MLPLMVLPGPIKLANVEPVRRMPDLPFAIAMSPVRSVPIMLPEMMVAARFWLNSSMPLLPLPEITLFKILTGSVNVTSEVTNWLEKLEMSACVPSGSAGKPLLSVDSTLLMFGIELKSRIG